MIELHLRHVGHNFEGYSDTDRVSFNVDYIVTVIGYNLWTSVKTNDGIFYGVVEKYDDVMAMIQHERTKQWSLLPQ